MYNESKDCVYKAEIQLCFAIYLIQLKKIKEENENSSLCHEIINKIDDALSLYDKE